MLRKRFLPVHDGWVDLDAIKIETLIGFTWQYYQVTTGRIGTKAQAFPDGFAPVSGFKRKAISHCRINAT
jgi:hypothetical protein